MGQAVRDIDVSVSYLTFDYILGVPLDPPQFQLSFSVLDKLASRQRKYITFCIDPDVSDTILNIDMAYEECGTPGLSNFPSGIQSQIRWITPITITQILFTGTSIGFLPCA